MTRSRFLLRAGLLAAGLVASGCSAQADIPEVIVTQSDVGFDGTLRVPGLPEITTTLETEFEHPKGLKLPEYFDTELRPISAKMTARDGMADLSFLRGVTLTLAARSEGAPPPRVVASYERPANGTIGREIDLETDRDSNVLEYWSTKTAYYDLEVTGVLPEDAWAVDVTVSFSGRLSISSD